MKISTILDHIDSGHIALPEFQRGYVWNRNQVRGLFDSLYRGYPVGSLLIWVTGQENVDVRGDVQPQVSPVQLLLDGQQRVTSLYGVIRGGPPAFFSGASEAFSGLYFNVASEEFEFWQPVKMQNDATWIAVTTLMEHGGKLFKFAQAASDRGGEPSEGRLGEYFNRLNHVVHIVDTDLPAQEITGADKTIEVVVDIFNRVNSGGTKLSQGDLALALICAEWPEARGEMQLRLAKWAEAGYNNFSLDWLLRSMNVILTRNARFAHMRGRATDDVRQSLGDAENMIDYLLNLIRDRLGLDHGRVLGGRNAFPVMVRYLADQGGKLDSRRQGRLLYWYVNAAIWGVFSGSSETAMDRCLAALSGDGDGLERLLKLSRREQWLRDVRPDDLDAATRGATFYMLIYLLTRIGEARDWDDGNKLNRGLLGKMHQLELHHIFPKRRLRGEFETAEINALANFCFQTKSTNLAIGAKAPTLYMPVIEERHPGALATQWIPSDRQLWEIDRYPDFLRERRSLLAEAAHEFLVELRDGQRASLSAIESAPEVVASGGFSSSDEEAALEEINDWVMAQGLHRGQLLHELVDDEQGERLAILDLAWPDGVQEGLSEPVAVLLDEPDRVLRRASAAGYRCFTSVEEFRRYVLAEVLGEVAPAA